MLTFSKMCSKKKKAQEKRVGNWITICSCMKMISYFCLSNFSGLPAQSKEDGRNSNIFTKISSDQIYTFQNTACVFAFISSNNHFHIVQLIWWFLSLSSSFLSSIYDCHIHASIHRSWNDESNDACSSLVEQNRVHLLINLSLINFIRLGYSSSFV